MSLSRPIYALSSFALATLAACGSGPTDGPKTPDEKLTVGGVLGDAGLTTAMTATQEPSVRSRPRAAVAESKRPADDDSVPMTDPGPDPMNGSFTLAQAAAGLPPTGALVATIKTSKGELRCTNAVRELELATVAVHATLARGLERVGLEQERRALRLCAHDLNYSWESADCLVVEFRLASGAFATTVLRELCDWNTQSA